MGRRICRLDLKRITVLVLCIVVFLQLLLICRLSVVSLFDDFAEREYQTYAFHVPQSERTLEAREWTVFRDSGVEFYLTFPNQPEVFLGEVDTDEYCPFSQQDYSLSWGVDGVAVQYGYSGNGLLKSIVLTWPETSSTGDS